MNRRTFLGFGGLALTGLAVPELARSAARLAGSRLMTPTVGSEPIEIRMFNDAAGRFLFDPIGLLVEPGQTVRWVLKSGVHSTTAYHPSNYNQSLRIPESATPWDSGILIEQGKTLDVTLTVPGVYDYYCLPHETAGMVGRIIVAEATGPGSLPFDYFTDRADAAEWRPMPVEAQAAFPSIERILSEKVVHPPSA